MTTINPIRVNPNTCSEELALPAWAFDGPAGKLVPGAPALTLPTYGPGASQHDRAPRSTPVQQPLPAEYQNASVAELVDRIWAAKRALGSRLVILGHHYQRDEIIQFADFRGDSFKLSQEAASRPDAEFIVFCGVHFMAESADILSGRDQRVVLPNLGAGCSMADMAEHSDVLDCWDALERVYGKAGGAGKMPIIPVTYMNSAASLKSFCGEHGGVVCTSSNAEAVLDWAFERGERVLFFPDQHLGRNTALKMGYKLDEMVVWSPRQPNGGNALEALERAKLVLWRGHCSVHARFTVAQIEEARRTFPGINVIVHPECPMDVVLAADEAGSTELIVKRVREAAPGTQWAIGTEISLVKRLQAEHPDKLVFCLDPVICPCSTMYRIHPAYLCWALENLVAGRVVNEIVVDDRTKKWAKVSLDRMLAIR